MRCKKHSCYMGRKIVFCFNLISLLLITLFCSSAYLWQIIFHFIFQNAATNYYSEWPFDIIYNWSHYHSECSCNVIFILQNYQSKYSFRVNFILPNYHFEWPLDIIFILSNYQIVNILLISFSFYRNTIRNAYLTLF